MSEPDIDIPNVPDEAPLVAPFAMIGAPLVRPLAISLGIGALVGGAVAAMLALARRASPAAAPAEHIPAAFNTAVDAADATPTRDAGPANVRDLDTDRVWDRTDEASDESFPASDPPSQR